MNSAAGTFLILNSIFLLLLPRQWAPMPLLVGACYMTLDQVIELGPFHFTLIRIVVAVGFMRVLLRGEWLMGRMNNLDRLMLVWAVWAVASGVFHQDPSGALVSRLGLVYNTCGVYFLLRIFCQSLDGIFQLCRLTAIVLIPVAIMILNEKITGYNVFSVFGGVLEMSAVREGSIRAQGPFAHPILAGTVGAVCLPLMIGMWQKYKKTALAGIIGCCSIIIASASSGPIMSGLVAIGALLMWRYRGQMKLVRWITFLSYLVLDLFMEAPAYYLLARIDLTGGSTGWHRAMLIESAITHLNEWWLYGTDYTRHWMPTGVSWSAEQTDITNYYIQMGVIGGLPLMLLFIAIIVKGFSFVGQSLKQLTNQPMKSQYIVWSLGASLFAHSASMISVSYYDQSVLFLYLNLALIGTLTNAVAMCAETSYD